MYIFYYFDVRLLLCTSENRRIFVLLNLTGVIFVYRLRILLICLLLNYLFAEIVNLYFDLLCNVRFLLHVNVSHVKRRLNNLEYLSYFVIL